MTSISISAFTFKSAPSCFLLSKFLRYICKTGSSNFFLNCDFTLLPRGGEKKKKDYHNDYYCLFFSYLLHFALNLLYNFTVYLEFFFPTVHLDRANAVKSWPVSRIWRCYGKVNSTEGNSKGQEELKSWLYPCRMGLAH